MVEIHWTLFAVVLLLSWKTGFLMRGMAWMDKPFLCCLGIHDWDGNTGEEYPPPRCMHCGVQRRSKAGR